jgi:hypothetical protein
LPAIRRRGERQGPAIAGRHEPIVQLAGHPHLEPIERIVDETADPPSALRRQQADGLERGAQLEAHARHLDLP